MAGPLVRAGQERQRNYEVTGQSWRQQGCTEHPEGQVNCISSAAGCRQVGGGAIYLCGRADGAPDRHFTGSVAHLALYNEALTPLQIRMIFAQARRPCLPYIGPRLQALT